jgi:hypothetical protein
MERGDGHTVDFRDYSAADVVQARRFSPRGAAKFACGIPLCVQFWKFDEQTPHRVS